MAKQFFIVNAATDIPEMMIYGYIGADYENGVSAADFVKQLKSLEQNHAQIKVKINSPGGNVFEGLAIYNAIKNSPAQIDTYVEGIAASMGSIIAMAGKKVYISSVGRLMTHQASGGVFGKADDMRANADLIDSLNKTMCSIYCHKTGMDEAACTAKFLSANDTWFTAADAVACKLVDEIYHSGIAVTGINMTDITALWGHFNNNLNFSMNYTLSPTSAAALGIAAATATPADIDAAINALVAKANKVDAITAQLTAAQADLAAFKKATTEKEITALVDAAVKDKKVSVAAGAILKTQFAENPVGLKSLLDASPAYVSVTEQIEQSGEKAITELAALRAMTYETLDKAGKLERLKALSPETFAAMYEAKFNKPYKK